jgi:hypothetical protein
VLVWPNGSEYRVLPPGAVRTLLGERRIDAIPLVRPQSSGKSDGPRRAGFATKKWELTTRTGKLVLEQAKLAGAGEGGTLFCRLLSEIAAVDPSAAPCSADMVPLRAQFTWPQGGSIAFDVLVVAEKTEFSGEQMLVPPAGGVFSTSNLPANSTGVLLGKEELSSFRFRPLELTADAGGVPDEGLVLHNGTDALRYAFLDSVPVAWVPPNGDQYIPGPLRGSYVMQWRTFLADAVDPPSTVEIPARVVIGLGIDAGR